MGGGEPFDLQARRPLAFLAPPPLWGKAQTKSAKFPKGFCTGSSLFENEILSCLDQTRSQKSKCLWIIKFLVDFEIFRVALVQLSIAFQ